MRLVRRETELRQRRSGGDALVAMVQASDLGNGDDLTSSWALCRARDWAIFGKREVCPGSMVVVDVGRENTPQVPLVEDDCIVQTVSADRANDALDVCILPGGARCCDDLLKTHNPDALTESVTIRSVPVPQEVARSAVPRKGFSYLVGKPNLCRMSGNPEMGDPSAVVPEDDHHVQHLKCSADDDEHIDGGNRLHMLFQESAPAWRGCAGTPRHIFSNSCLPYADPKLEEFTMDAWCAPERVGLTHLADQSPDLAIDARPTETAGSRSPPPVEPEARSMPLDHSCRFHQHHDLEALRPESVQQSPEKPIPSTDTGSAGVLAPKHGQLVPEGHHLKCEGASAAKPAGEHRNEG